MIEEELFQVSYNGHELHPKSHWQQLKYAKYVKDIPRMQYQLSYAHETKTFYIIEKTSKLLNEACGDSPFGCCIQ